MWSRRKQRKILLHDQAGFPMEDTGRTPNYWCGETQYQLSWISCYIARIVLNLNPIQDNASTLASRVKKTDAREIESFYKQYYEQYVVALNKGEQADRYQNLLVLWYLISWKANIFGYILAWIDISVFNFYWQSCSWKSLSDSWSAVWSSLCC